MPASGGRPRPLVDKIWYYLLQIITTVYYTFHNLVKTRSIWNSFKISCYTFNMDIDLPSTAPPYRKRRNLLELLLLFGFIGSLLIGIAALAAIYIWQDTSRPSPTTLTIHTLDNSQVVPALALMELAGDPADALAVQALHSGELDTALAILLYTTNISSSQRLYLLQLLGRRFLEANDTTQATQAFLLARSAAILDPSLKAMERHQALTTIARGFIDLNAHTLALETAIQVQRIATQSPEFLPAQRAQVFETLRPIAEQLDNSAFRQEMIELVRNPYLNPTGLHLNNQWSTLSEPLIPDALQEEKVAVRQQAARQLAERIILTGGADVEPERFALATALQAEDQTRAGYYQRTLSAGISLPQQHQLLLERRAWLVLKARIASGAFGFSIVPEWEANQTHIFQDISTAIYDLNIIVDAQLNALSDPVEKALLRVELLRWLALQVELGLHPGGQLTDIHARLQLVQDELARNSQGLALPVALDAAAEPTGFRIQPQLQPD
jgi:hypothetical protein